MKHMKSFAYVPPRTRLIVVGGFLGAGKTTAILRIAKELLDRGKTLAIVTNDQGSDLVDSETLRRHGLHVIEISGGCFCTSLDEFSDQLEAIGRERDPDVILAEPVGSCINLVATVFGPLLRKRSGLAMAPLSVVADPRRLLRVMNPGSAVMPDEIGYLFRKQLEEADLIALNKCDLLTPAQTEACRGWLQEHMPGAEILEVSAAEGQGIPEWTDRLLRLPAAGRKQPLDVAYDVYAAAESALAWLNLRADIRWDELREPDAATALLRGFVTRLQQEIRDMDGDAVHIKAHLLTATDWARVSCTGNDQEVRTDHELTARLNEAGLLLNIRALADPDPLLNRVKQAVADVFGDHALLRPDRTEAFRPDYAGPSCPPGAD